MKNYILPMLAIIMVSLTNQSKAQFGTDYQGKPVLQSRYEDLTGSPFYEKDFVKGSILRNKNTQPYEAYLQYDQVKDALIVKKEVGAAPIELTEIVAEFRLFMASGDTVLFRPYVSAEGKFFYCQVLQDGQTALVKQVKKKVLETQVYNSANINKTVAETIYYFLVMPDAKLVPVKDKKSFLIAFANKTKEMGDYISTQKINFKSDKDLAKLVSYYNTLYK